MIAAAAAVAAMALCYLLMVHLPAGRNFDQAALAGAVRNTSHRPHLADQILARITGKSFLLVLLAVFGIGLIRRRPLLGAGAAIAAGSAVEITQILKYHVLDRSVFASTAAQAGDTFPSGHTAVAIGCAMALVLVVPARWRGFTAVAVGTCSSLVAIQVQDIGWHRPSDAIGAALLCFGCVAGVAAILAWIRPVQVMPRQRLLVAPLTLGAVAVVCVVITVLGIQDLSGSLASTASHPAVQHRAYVTGVAATVATIAALLTALLFLLRRLDLDSRSGREAGQLLAAR